MFSGSSSTEAASLYARYRAPTGLVVRDNPLRYVLEVANTVFLGDQRGLLGFNNLTSVGAGIEFDSRNTKRSSREPESWHAMLLVIMFVVLRLA